MTPYIGSYGDVVNRAGLSHTSYPPPLPPPTVNLIPPWAVQVNKGCHSNVGTMSGQRLRRWPDIVPALPRFYVLSTFFSLCANHKYLGPHPARSCVSAPPPPATSLLQDSSLILSENTTRYAMPEQRWISGENGEPIMNQRWANVSYSLGDLIDHSIQQ